jgi:deoxyxylulose-5-phosphate synthase
MFLALITCCNFLIINSIAVSDKTYLVGHDFSLADIAMVLLLRRLGYVSGDAETRNGVFRWFALCASQVPDVKIIPCTVTMPSTATVIAATGAGTGAAGAAGVAVPGKKGKEKKEEGAVKGADKAKGDKKDEDEDLGGSCPPLDGAIYGKVCA